MINTKASMPYAQAKELAVKICYQLQPHCVKDRLNIAGSIRRQKPFVGDIEICCVPLFVDHTDRELFGGGMVTRSPHPGFIAAVSALGDSVKGKTTGRYMQIELPEGVKLDLFMPEASDYFRQYAIRTGSAQYAQHVIASGWLKLGWCGVKDLGLRRQGDCVGKRKPDGKTEWKLCRPNPTLPPVWESERAFFDWLQVPYLEPAKRNL